MKEAGLGPFDVKMPEAPQSPKRVENFDRREGAHNVHQSLALNVAVPALIEIEHHVSMTLLQQKTFHFQVGIFKFACPIFDFDVASVCSPRPLDPMFATRA